MEHCCCTEGWSSVWYERRLKITSKDIQTQHIYVRTVLPCISTSPFPSVHNEVLNLRNLEHTPHEGIWIRIQKYIYTQIYVYIYIYKVYYNCPAWLSMEVIVLCKNRKESKIIAVHLQCTATRKIACLTKEWMQHIISLFILWPSCAVMKYQFFPISKETKCASRKR